MARVSTINAEDFIKYADKVAEGESPDIIRNAFEEQIERKNRQTGDSFNYSDLNYTPFAEAKKSRYSALAGKKDEDTLNFIEKTYGVKDRKINTDAAASKAENSEVNNSIEKNKNKDANKEISSNPAEKNLSESEKKKVEELKRIDAKVRAHEMAHQAAGAGLVRGKSFTYTTGPDGKQYATAGEVKIDMSVVSDDPDATIRKMQQVRRAALAPSDPSATDRSVASKASSLEAKARAEKSGQMSEEAQSNDNKADRLFDKYINNGNDSESGNNIDISERNAAQGAIPGVTSLKGGKTASNHNPFLHTVNRTA